MSIPTYIFHIRDNQTVLSPEQIAEYERAWNDLTTTFEIVPVRPHHDGNLDEKADCTVDYSPKSKKSGTYIRILMHDDGAVLTPAQALSLLDWLIQEEGRLKSLAKEQAE